MNQGNRNDWNQRKLWRDKADLVVAGKRRAGKIVGLFTERVCNLNRHTGRVMSGGDIGGLTLKLPVSVVEAPLFGSEHLSPDSHISPNF